MYNDLMLEQAVSDFLFYEPEENIGALKSYVESVNKNSENISETLEDHIFSRLDIYLEDFSLILEEINKPKDIQKHNSEAQKKIRELESKGELSSSDKKNLGSLRNIPQSGKADQYSKVEEIKKKKKSEKTDQQRKETQEKWNKRVAKKERKSLIRDIDKKLGRPTLRKAIADKVKKAWKKTKLRKAIRKAIKTGVVAGKKIAQSTDSAKRKIEGARKTFKKKAAEYEALVAQQKKGTENWRKIKAKQAELEQARGTYKKIRMRAPFFRRRVLKTI